jgi:lipoate-protein ligase B
MPMTRHPQRKWLAVNLPETPYPDALALQHRLVAARIEDPALPNVVLLLEHAPVYTLGRRGGRENIMVTRTVLDEYGIDVVATERGGFITYHGPGQLVVYPIVDIKGQRIGVADFVAAMESAMIRVSAEAGVSAARRPRTAASGWATKNWGASASPFGGASSTTDWRSM